MKKLNIIALIGLFIGVTLILVAMMMQGSIMIFWSLSSFIITVAGSFCALLVSYTPSSLFKLPNVFKQAFVTPDDKRLELVAFFAKMAKQSRTEGLLSLEDGLADIEDEFLLKGMQMVVDGMERESIREILEFEIDTIEKRHGSGHEIFKSWGDYAPAFGMIGTLIGLIGMLSNLSDANAIGKGMATALITTFYGAFFANMVLIPIATKLENQTDKEIFTKEMIIEGILSIQSGINPRIVEQKLKVYLSPNDRVEHVESMVS